MAIVNLMADRLGTERLVLRSWTDEDAGAALGAYGDARVARWLTPAMDRVPDLAAMRGLLRQWLAEDAQMMAPAGRWAVELRRDSRVIGGATLLPPPPDEEIGMGWVGGTEKYHSLRLQEYRLRPGDLTAGDRPNPR